MICDASATLVDFIQRLRLTRTCYHSINEEALSSVLVLLCFDLFNAFGNVMSGCLE